MGRTPAPDDQEGYRIANNHVHHCGTDYFGAIGIFVDNIQESVVAHNLIHDIPYAGMVLGGTEPPEPPIARNNVVECNDVYDVMKVATDGAGIYIGFSFAGWGAVLRNNVFHDSTVRSRSIREMICRRMVPALGLRRAFTWTPALVELGITRLPTIMSSDPPDRRFSCSVPARRGTASSTTFSEGRISARGACRGIAGPVRA